MKKLFIVATAVLAFGGIASADIQAPPGHAYNSTRKLGRAFSNILYSVLELPEQVARKTKSHGASAGFSYGIVDGTTRGLKRLGYGFYELITFAYPTYRGTFKPPYESKGMDNREQMNPTGGLSEFPPELGFESYFRNTRSQTY